MPILKFLLSISFLWGYNIYSSEISTETVSVGINQSLYDFEFTEKLIEYFKIEDKRKEIYELKKRGFYRTELIFLVKMSIEKNIELAQIIKEITKKKKTVYEIAKEYNYDVGKNFISSIIIRKEIELKIDDLKKLKDIVKKEFLNEK